MSTIEKAAKMFLFEGVNQVEMKKVLSQGGCEEVAYTSGETIFDPQVFQRKLGLVLKGKLRVYGGQALLNIIGEGGVFGAAALFGNEESYCSHLQAVGSCEILYFSEDMVRELIQKNGTIALNYVRFLSDKIRFLNGKIATFTADCAKSKLVQYLMSQAGAQHSQDGSVKMPISYQKLAETLNMGRASLYRAFEQLENDGWLRKEGKTVYLNQILEGDS